MDGGDAIVGGQTGERGTLAVVLGTPNQSQTWRALTNSHVIARVGNDATSSQIFELINVNLQEVAKVMRHNIIDVNRTNHIDLAVLLPTIASSTGVIKEFPNHFIMGTYAISEFESPDRPFFYGSEGGIVVCNVPIRIEEAKVQLGSGMLLSYGRFYILHVQAGSMKPKPGHSGSLLCVTGNQPGQLMAAGIVFGGTDDIFLAYSWADVRMQLAAWNI